MATFNSSTSASILEQVVGETAAEELQTAAAEELQAAEAADLAAKTLAAKASAVNLPLRYSSAPNSSAPNSSAPNSSASDFVASDFVASDLRISSLPSAPVQTRRLKSAKHRIGQQCYTVAYVLLVLAAGAECIYRLIWSMQP